MTGRSSEFASGGCSGHRSPVTPGQSSTREELFAGWRRFFERLASTAPVAILIEDAHHARTELLEFVDHLVDWVRDLPLFVLVFARTEIDERRPDFGSGRNRVRVTLDPLDASSMDALVEALIPGSPSPARSMIVERAQGIPLYAVESIRALIDRDVVRPIEGVYRIVGDVGQLEVPDSLHALLAARLDALDPQVRQVLTGAAVLGSSFPAEAVAGVSGLPSATVESILGELLRREVLQVSADPRSPERGNYRFSQEMLRQVAYETLSRRDRKARHLAVAAHLRATFPRDGEEVIDVVARHYVDALEAVPDDQRRRRDPRAGGGGDDQGGRACLPGRRLRPGHVELPRCRRPRRAGRRATTHALADLLLRAAQASTAEKASTATVRVAERAVEAHVNLGDERALARARTVLGRLLRRLGRHTDARVQLTAALEVLRENPDIDTTHAIEQLASLETFAGTSAANRLTEEALEVVASLDLPSRLPDVMITRAIYLDVAGRRREAAMYFREAARLADEPRDHAAVGRWRTTTWPTALMVDDPVDAAEARARGLRPRPSARATGTCSGPVSPTSSSPLRRRPTGTMPPEALTDNPNRHLFADDDFFITVRCLVQLRYAAMQTSPTSCSAKLNDMLASEDRPGHRHVWPPLERSRRWRATTMARRCARAASPSSRWSGPCSFAGDDGRWAWPLAARCAHELGDLTAEAELLDICERHQPGQLAPMQRAEALLIRARLAAAEQAADAADQFVLAVEALRSISTPYHLAHGLLDHAGFLAAAGDSAAAEQAVAEARSIATGLGCRPLLDRVRRTLPRRLAQAAVAQR